MYKKILVSYDGSDGSKIALNSAIEIAKSLDAKITALWVGGFKPYYHETVAEVDEENESINSFAAKLKNEIKNTSNKEGIHIEFTHLQGNPAKLIVEFASKQKFDLIVIGGMGHSGLWGNNLGHVTDKVSENAKCDILIARR
jgi:nucleotide-binding universal stress UspA family protein